MKLAFVTSYPPDDPSQSSGLGYFISRALRAQGCELDTVGPLSAPRMELPVRKTKSLLYNRILSKRYHPGHTIGRARHYARQVDNYLSRNPAIEAVVSPGNIPIAFLETRLPIVFWSDATHAALFNFYPEYTDPCAELFRHGNAIEIAALDRCAAAIFSSEWAAGSALRDYGADPAKVHVVPFGANVESLFSDNHVAAAIGKRAPDACELLFIGTNWQRKGGPLAVEVAATLNRLGLPTRLTVVGCTPFKENPAPSFVRCEGFLSKHNPGHRRKFEQLLIESHFLLVPSQAECYGHVYCEASAFGVPSLACDVGGVSSTVHNDVNGQLFDRHAPASAYAAHIQAIFGDYGRYRELALSSRRRFRERLNWEVAGRTAKNIIENAIRAQRNAHPTRAAVKQ